MTEHETTPAGAFGPEMRRLRMEKGYTLRDFSLAVGVDAGNYSRVERGLFSPPADDVIDQYVHALGLDPTDADVQRLKDLAAIDRGHLPKDLLHDDQVVGELPLLFRTLRGEPVTDEQMDRLVELIRRKSASEHKGPKAVVQPPAKRRETGADGTS